MSVGESHVCTDKARLQPLRLGALVAICALCAPAVYAHAAPLPWSTEPYRYLVVDQDLRIVLEEFGRNLGVKLAMSEAVKGRVRGSLPQLPPRDFIDYLARTYGLEWYFDGAIMTVSATGEAETRILALHALDFKQLERGLMQAGIADQRFMLREGPGPGLAMVSGPPRFVQLVAQSVVAMASQTAPLPHKPPVQVFRGSVAAR